MTHNPNHAVLFCLVLAYGCSGTDEAPPAPAEVVLTSIAVTAPSLTVAKDGRVRFRADGTYTDGSTANVTPMVTWTSSDPTVATITEQALATGLEAGSTEITAKLGAVEGTATLVVDPAPIVALAIRPTTALELNPGGAATLSAFATLADDEIVDVTSRVTWTSSDEAVVTVDEGQVTAVAAGDAVITVEDAETGVASEESVTIAVRDPLPIAIDITPSGVVELALGLTQQFTATARYEDETTVDVTAEVAWSSSTETIATVGDEAGDKGLVTTLDDGNTTITARHGPTGLRGVVRVVVRPAALTTVTVSPQTATLELDGVQRFRAMGVYSDGTERDLTNSITWMSSDTAVLTISNEAGSQGRARPASPGVVTVSAVDENSGVSSDDSNGSATITVNTPVVASLLVLPGTANIAAGLIEPFRAFAIYSDNSGVEITDTAIWASSDPSVATVDASGNVRAVAVGTAVISATDSVSGISSDANMMSAEVTVDPPILLSIAVTPAAAAMVVGSVQQFTATAEYSDGIQRDISTTVTWTPSSSALSVTATGLATANAVGNVTLVASDETEGVSSEDSQESASILITDAQLVSIAVSPSPYTLPVGAQIALTALGTYDNNATVDVTEIVTWASSDPAVAAVGNAAGARGVARGIAAGTAFLSATETISGISSTMSAQSSTVTVPAGVTVQSIAVTPPSATFNVNRSFAFSAIGTFSDASTHPMTESVTWASSASSVATVSNTEGTRGLALGASVGTAGISATHAASGVTSSASNQDAIAIVEQGIEIADVVHYELDDASGATVTNSAPGQSDGTINGTFAWNTPGGAPTPSSHYLTMPTGSSNHIAPNLSSTAFTNLTIEFWWRFGSGTGLSYVWNSGVSFRAFTNGVAGAGLYVRETPGGADIVYAPSVQDGSWHHIAYVLDATGGQGLLYVDSVQVGSTTYSGSINITSWVLAGQAATNGATVDFDRLRVWSTAQTAAQVAEMFNGTR